MCYPSDRIIHPSLPHPSSPPDSVPLSGETPPRFVLKRPTPCRCTKPRDLPQAPIRRMHALAEFTLRLRTGSESSSRSPALVATPSSASLVPAPSHASRSHSERGQSPSRHAARRRRSATEQPAFWQRPPRGGRKRASSAHHWLPCPALLPPYPVAQRVTRGLHPLSTAMLIRGA